MKIFYITKNLFSKLQNWLKQPYNLARVSYWAFTLSAITALGLFVYLLYIKKIVWDTSIIDAKVAKLKNYNGKLEDLPKTVHEILDEAKSTYKIITRDFVQVFFTCFAGIAITQIWENIINQSTIKVNTDKNTRYNDVFFNMPKVVKTAGQQIDYGLIFLAAALFCWIPTRLLKMLYMSLGIEQNKIISIIVILLFFSLNSVFIIKSLTYFEHFKSILNTRIVRFLNKNTTLKITRENARHWAIVIFSIVFIIATATSCYLYFYTKNVSEQIKYELALKSGQYWLLFVDVFITIQLIFWVFKATFQERNLPMLVKLNYVLYGVLLVSQILAILINESSSIYIFFSTLFRDLFVPTLLAIAFSWSWDISNKELANEKELLAGQMNHAVRSNLRVLSRALDDMLESSTILNNPENQSIVQDFSLRVSRILSLHNQIHDSGKPVVNVKYHLTELILKIKETHNYLENNFKFSIKLPDRIFLRNKDGELLSVIVAELANNSFEHGPRPDHQLSIDIELDNGRDLKIIIIDNGPGIIVDTSVHPVRVKISPRGKRKMIIKSSGSGLNYVNTIVTKWWFGDFGGKPRPDQQNGTVFWITIPNFLNIQV